MRSLRQQILILLLAALILLATSFILVLGWHMKERAISAAIIKAKTDLATCTEIVNLMYPGEWRVSDGALYKGEARISQQYELVDRLSVLTGDTVTIFLNDTRVATTVRGTDGERALGTKVSDVVAQKVLRNGEIYLGEANVVGQVYQTAYEPLRDAQGNIIGMFYVGISQSYAQEMITNSLWQTAILGMGLTVLVGLLTWILAEKIWIRPLRKITFGTRDLATGHATAKVEVSGPEEIGELATAFNQMIERLEGVARGFEQHTQPPERVEIENIPEELDPIEIDVHLSPTVNYENSNVILETILLNPLPKGLNKETLRQIFEVIMELNTPASAEEIAEGVKLTRVTVRRYLEFLEQCNVLKSELKYGTVGRPVRLWFRNQGL